MKNEKLPSPVWYKLGEYVVPSIIALAIVSSFFLVYYAMDKNTNSNVDGTVNSATTPTPTVTDHDSFSLKVLKEGTGNGAKTGDTVSVYYKGTLKDTGAVFDASENHKNADGSMTPFTFTLGKGEVIKGWDQGLVGMKVGEKRQLVIPSSLGYGAGGYPPVIPANATLVFEVEMVKVGK